MAAAQLRAACAPWSEKGAKLASEFIQSLGGGGDAQEPERSSGELLQLFAEAGIPIKEFD